MLSKKSKTTSSGGFVQVRAESTETRNTEKKRGNSDAFLLMIGSVLIFLTFMRFGVSELGWVVFAPFLVYLQDRRSVKQHLVLLATLIVAYLLTVAKIVTDGLPLLWVPMCAIPIASSYFLMLTFAGMAGRKMGARWAVYTFAAMAAVMGWIQYSFTLAASWGILAHTQLENLPLIQLAALTGVGGITFVVALSSGLLAAVWRAGLQAMRIDVLVFGMLLLGALLSGNIV